MVDSTAVLIAREVCMCVFAVAIVALMAVGLWLVLR
jgi:hypothetical protein